MDGWHMTGFRVIGSYWMWGKNLGQRNLKDTDGDG